MDGYEIGRDRGAEGQVKAGETAVDGQGKGGKLQRKVNERQDRVQEVALAGEASRQQRLVQHDVPVRDFQLSQVHLEPCQDDKRWKAIYSRRVIGKGTVRILVQRVERAI